MKKIIVSTAATVILTAFSVNAEYSPELVPEAYKAYLKCLKKELKSKDSELNTSNYKNYCKKRRKYIEEIAEPHVIERVEIMANKWLEKKLSKTTKNG